MKRICPMCDKGPFYTDIEWLRHLYRHQKENLTKKASEQMAKKDYEMRKCYVCRGEDMSTKPGSINWLCRRHTDEELITVVQKEKAAVNGSSRKEKQMLVDVDRKLFPIYTGVLRYFPDALLAVAEVSRIGNEQHNPDQPLHWDRNKSTDDLDSLTRHLLDAGTFDTDGIRHSAKVVWRALANLQKEIEHGKDTCAKQ